jgi:putative transposase
MQLLSKYIRLYRTDLIGYALMENHVHQLHIPEHKTSLAKAVGRTNNDYARWQNLQCNRTGHLFQARFFSCIVESDALWDVLAYVELNPVRAGLVEAAEEWKWSSARAHFTGIDETGLLDMRRWQEHFDPASWNKFCCKNRMTKNSLTRFGPPPKRVVLLPAMQPLKSSSRS